MHLAVGAIVGFLTRQQKQEGAFAVGHLHLAVEVGAVAKDGDALAVLGQP